ncbi:MAG TPA: hypothetical protein DCG19_09040 [Cryomorphaceae bacterium]|nr:hypothetical protein [Owenweeksia sp.]MBF97405.1 hypothetical protein [Owenweeksia sp.]HAD97539.1 hypothetical protein [Cryomorphaceae bacterium]HBF20926.1 hypothetical protein [Cryomorphaceae bacterium]HCQ17015.1 hypothetical protein [Cryomorphaceae bacterium]|tara:strand:+ start:1093 stop:2598 length:1506 start_codon:yes stop_codon:yes gene_type:complete
MKTILHTFWTLFQNFGAWLLESTESILDNALDNLVGKDHSLKAKFASESSILSRRHNGFCLTGTKSISPELSRTGVLINGGSGSGKSTIAGIPSCLQDNGSKIIHDPSGELYEKTSGFLESQGYTIIRIDWSDANHSHRFNPLHRATTLSHYSKLATQLVEASSEKKKDFWNASAISLLVTVFRIVKLLPKEYQTLREAAHIVDLLQGTGHQEVDRLVATVCDRDPGLFDKYASLMGNSENTRSGILASASTALKMYDLDEHIIRVTSTDTLGDFKQWRKEKTVVYIHSSTVNMDYYAPLSSIFLTQYFESFFESLPDNNDLNMSFILDETPILTINLSILAANVRKYAGSIAVFCQDAENQLTTSFGREGARSILSNLKTKLYLTASLDTAQALSKELGSYQYQDKETGHQKTRPLMTVDEIMTLPKGKGLITVTNEKPILAKLTPYYRIPSLLKKTQLPPASLFTDIEDGEDRLPPLINISEYLQSLTSNTTTHEQDTI